MHKQRLNGCDTTRDVSIRGVNVTFRLDTLSASLSKGSSGRSESAYKFRILVLVT